MLGTDAIIHTRSRAEALGGGTLRDVTTVAPVATIMLPEED